MRITKLILSVLTFGLFLFIAMPTKAADTASVLFENVDSTITVGKILNVKVYINSSVPINAAQLSITYPQASFSLISVDSSNSSFSIKAKEVTTPGVIMLARGNIKALSGKQLLTVLKLKALRNSASTTQLGYLSADSLVMSENNVNILSGSEVMTVKPNVPSPTTAIQRYTKYGQNQSKGFFKVISQAVKDFFHDLFH